MTTEHRVSASEKKGKSPQEPANDSFWLVRYSKALIGLVLALMGLGIYFAFQIPTGVFRKPIFPESSSRSTMA